MTERLVTLDQCRVPSCLGCGRHVGHPHHDHCTVVGMNKDELAARIKRALDRLKRD
jgi:hypothetical protein